MPRELVADEELLLALLNSSPVVDGRPRDDLADDAAARDWLRAAGGPGDDDERATARRARTLLQDVVRGARPPSDLAPLLEGVSRVPELDGDGVRWRLAAPAPRRTVARAVLAWAALAATLPGRLRPCGNDECALFFVDRSRAGTGRWCSMAVCGNRMKARRHQARERTEAP